jgi:hypothetical protein
MLSIFGVFLKEVAYMFGKLCLVVWKLVGVLCFHNHGVEVGDEDV